MKNLLKLLYTSNEMITVSLREATIPPKELARRVLNGGVTQIWPEAEVACNILQSLVIKTFKHCHNKAT